MRELTVPEAPRHARDGPARSLALLLTGSLGGLSVRCDTCARLFRSVDKASQGCVRDGGFGQGRTTRRRIYLAVRTSECTWGGGGGGGGGGGRRLEEMLGSRSGTGRWARPDRGTDQRCSCTSLRPSLGRNLSLVFSADSFISKKSKSSVPVAQAEPRSRRGRSTSESQSG